MTEHKCAYCGRTAPWGEMQLVADDPEIFAAEARQYVVCRDGEACQERMEKR